MSGTSHPEATASTGRLANIAILRRISGESTDSERQMTMSGAMPMRRSSFTECWVGCLQLAGVVDVWDQRQVDEHAAPAPDVDRELADRLEERQRLDVADRAADLGDHEVDVAGLGDQRDPLLDLVGDVRHDLHRPTEVVAAALAADHRVVDAA